MGKLIFQKVNFAIRLLCLGFSKVLPSILGFSDAGGKWRESYENANFETEIKELFDQVGRGIGHEVQNQYTLAKL